jgi:type I restriction enzyme S subunit
MGEREEQAGWEEPGWSGGGWHEARIGDLGRVVTGATPRAADPGSWAGGPDGAVDFITPRDQRAGVRWAAPARWLSAQGARRLASRVVPAGATCVTCIGQTIGKTSLTTGPAVTNQQIHSVVPDPAVVLPEFLYYLLTAHGPRIARAASGSAAWIVNKRQFSRYVVRIPPMTAQQRAAGVLGALDGKIAANECTIAAALDLADALFEKASAGQGRWCRLGDVAELRYGKALPAARRRPGAVPVYGSGGIVGTHDTALVAGPGVIVGRKGTAGAVHWSQRDFVPIDTVFYVLPTDNGVPLEFLFFALGRMGLPALTSDSAIPGLTRASALATRVLLPSADETRDFQRSAGGLLALREALQAENAQLATLRDILLPSLVLEAVPPAPVPPDPVPT